MSETPQPEPTVIVKKRGIHISPLQLVISTIVLVVLAIGTGYIAFEVMKFRSMAEGIAVGYAEASITAYQMDRYARPMPNRIFEVGNYRVEVRMTHTPPKLEVFVRDRYLNITHYELERQFEVAGRPETPEEQVPQAPQATPSGAY